jgi:hypothetical protein
MDAGCATHHNCVGSKCSGEGLGQTYSSPCVPLGTPGTDSSYSLAMATAAAAAVTPQPPSGALCLLSPTGQCTGTATCPTTGTTANVYFLDDSDNGGPCYVWSFASNGSTYVSGHVYASTSQCTCPISTDPTWD